MANYAVREVLPVSAHVPGECIHQSLMGDDSRPCSRPVLRGVSHGFHCDEHYTIPVRRRVFQSDPEMVLIDSILKADKRALSHGRIVNHYGVLTHEA